MTAKHILKLRDAHFEGKVIVTSNCTAKPAYLKHHVLVEPLINQWYAWPYLVCPSTAAMYVANHHIELMESFVTNPQLHVSALRNPAFLGGPFINYGPDKVPQIKQLLEQTIRKQAALLELASAIKELDQILTEEATGLSLAPLYKRVPEALKGLVELVYDEKNHASVRFIEGLLYRSRYYDETTQSLTLTVADRDERPFVFSTPRLPCSSRLTLNVPFRDGGIDDLFEAKTQARSAACLAEKLGLDPPDAPGFAILFAQDRPATASRYQGDGVRVRYFGHACLLIETKDVSILTDPAISYGFADAISRYTYSDLPAQIDYVLITHQHQDHCIFESLLQLRHKIGTVIVPRSGSGSLLDPSLKRILEVIGFRSVRELDELEVIDLPQGMITGLPFLGEHGDLNIRSKVAYLINLENRSVLCAADSNALEPRLYQRIHGIVGDLDVLFAGMECDGAPLSWLYGPLLATSLTRAMDQSRRFDASDCERVVEIMAHLKPEQVYVYAMGQEPWLTYLTSLQYTPASRPIVESDKLIEDSRKRGLVCERLYGQKELYLDAR